MEHRKWRGGLQRGTVPWKPILGWAVASLFTSAAVYGLVLASRSGTSSDGAVDVAAVSAADWTKGDRNAAVTLVEYADFQCPACGTYYPIVKQVVEKYGSRILYVYREFPLTQIHKNGDLAARAAEAAGTQGKYWQMYDELYTNQNAWAEAADAQAIMESYAKDIGLDTEKWKNDIGSDAVKSKIAADVASGEAALVDSTPTFFLSGKLLDVNASVDFFTAAIDAELARVERDQSANVNEVTNTNGK